MFYLVQGSVYILNSFGAFPDTLYILPTRTLVRLAAAHAGYAQPGLLRAVRPDCHRSFESHGLCERSGRLRLRHSRNL